MHLRTLIAWMGGWEGRTPLLEMQLVGFAVRQHIGFYLMGISRELCSAMLFCFFIIADLTFESSLFVSSTLCISVMKCISLNTYYSKKEYPSVRLVAENQALS